MGEFGDMNFSEPEFDSVTGFNYLRLETRGLRFRNCGNEPSDMSMVFVWFATPCGLVRGYQRFLEKHTVPFFRSGVNGLQSFVFNTFSGVLHAIERLKNILWARPCLFVSSVSPRIYAKSVTRCWIALGTAIVLTLLCN